MDVYLEIMVQFMRFSSESTSVINKSYSIIYANNFSLLRRYFSYRKLYVYEFKKPLIWNLPELSELVILIIPFEKTIFLHKLHPCKLYNFCLSKSVVPCDIWDIRYWDNCQYKRFFISKANIKELIFLKIKKKELLFSIFITLKI